LADQRRGLNMAGDDKRQRILDAAETAFRAGRFHEITMDSVAAAAGVGKGTLYLYFRNKDDLFFQLTTSGFDELCDLLRRRVDQQSPFEAQLMQSAAAISSFFRNRRQLFDMIQAADAGAAASRDRARSSWLKKRHLLMDALADVMRRGQQTGLMDGQLPPRAAAVFFLGLLRARARDLDGGDTQVTDAALVGFFLHGVASAVRGAAARRPEHKPSPPEKVP
jgi:AcrR family transcriptional regulator